MSLSPSYVPTNLTDQNQIQIQIGGGGPLDGQFVGYSPGSTNQLSAVEDPNDAVVFTIDQGDTRYLFVQNETFPSGWGIVSFDYAQGAFASTVQVVDETLVSATGGSTIDDQDGGDFLLWGIECTITDTSMVCNQPNLEQEYGAIYEEIGFCAGSDDTLTFFDPTVYDITSIPDCGPESQLLRRGGAQPGHRVINIVFVD